MLFVMLFRFVWKVLIALTVSAVLLAVAFVVLFLEDQPILPPAPAPTSGDVSAARQLVRDIRDAANFESGDRAPPPLTASVAQFNSIVSLSARFIPGSRGRLWIEEDRVTGKAAFPLPWIDGDKWLNLEGVVPPFTGTFQMERLTVGGRDVPPDLALFLARTGANLIGGDRFGDKVLQSASAMHIDGDILSFKISLDEMGKNGVMRGTFGMLRGAQMPSADEVEFFHRQIREAMMQGELPQNGSFLPFLEFTLSQALEHSTPQTLPNTYTAAIFGLAKACGARDFAMIVGRLAFDGATDERNWPVSCEEILFNERIDSRRHFITSAALQAASNTGFAISIGEFKELYDTISGAGGFDFTDMAANLSGVRMSNVLMTLPTEDWPARLLLLETERDVIISFEGIPGLLPEEAFNVQFGDVNNPAYKDMLARIEVRIDNLRFYRGL